MFTLEDLFHSIAQLVIGLTFVGLLSLPCGLMLATALRLRQLRWTWSVLLIFPALLSVYISLWIVLLGLGTCFVSCIAGMVLQSHDLIAGGDHAQAARARLGLIGAVQRVVRRVEALAQPQEWVRAGRLEVGRNEQGTAVTIPAGGQSGSHTLLLGATGSGKTCGQAWIASRLIEHGHAAIAIDPKGDPMLAQELQRAAEAVGAPFLVWSPDGPLAYNPYARGSATEIADKALAGEVFTEPHYLRKAQRYLGHALRTMHAAGVEVTPASLMAHMDPGQLEQTAKLLPDDEKGAVREYLDSHSERSKNDLAGVRDRLSILAESDVARWLDPAGAARTIDLEQQVRERAVVYFSLEADRRPLLAQMLASAIVGDLITLAAELQRSPVPTVLAIDEFSGVAASQVSRLFARARSAGMSLLLATQELADLRAAGHDALRDQVLGNVEALIAYRQNVPESAELVALTGGTRAVWVATQEVSPRLFREGATGGGSRTRGQELVVHPTRVKQLRTGEAVVVTPGSEQAPVVARMHHPRAALARGAGREGVFGLGRAWRSVWPGLGGPGRAGA